jgi:uncharacterized protein
LNKAKILRQIQSNKARKFKTINDVQNIGAVVVSSFITFLGFYGTQKFHSQVNTLVTIDIGFFEFLFNILVFLLFVIVSLHLLFHFNERQSAAERAIVLLTTFINEIEDAIHGHRNTLGKDTEILTETFRQKYVTIIQIIPSNSDKEFLAAKKDFSEKESKVEMIDFPMQIFDNSKLEKLLLAIIKHSRTLIGIYF